MSVRQDIRIDAMGRKYGVSVVEGISIRSTGSGCVHCGETIHLGGLKQPTKMIPSPDPGAIKYHPFVWVWAYSPMAKAEKVGMIAFGNVAGQVGAVATDLFVSAIGMRVWSDYGYDESLRGETLLLPKTVQRGFNNAYRGALGMPTVDYAAEDRATTIAALAKRMERGDSLTLKEIKAYMRIVKIGVDTPLEYDQVLIWLQAQALSAGLPPDPPAWDPFASSP